MPIGDVINARGGGGWPVYVCVYVYVYVCMYVDGACH